MSRWRRFWLILRAGFSGLREVPIRRWPAEAIGCVAFAWRMSGELWVCVRPAVELERGRG